MSAIRYALLALLLLTLVFLTGSFWLMGVLILLVLLPPVSCCGNLLTRKNLHLTITLQTTAGKNTAIGGRLTIRNASILPVWVSYIRLWVCNDLTGETQSITLSGAVAAKGTTNLDFLLQSRHCGRLYLLTEQVTLLDVLGLLPTAAGVKASARVTVLPELFPCEANLSGLSATDNTGTADRRGDDLTEVLHLRQYIPGDQIRQIHWKLSSKLGELMVKEPSLPVQRSVLVFWDKRTPATAEVMDALAAAVSSVSQAVAESGSDFTLCWPGKEELEYREITQSQELLTAIPAMIKDRGSETCSLPNLEDYGLVLYFTNNANGIQSATGQIFPLICQQTPEDIPGALVFTPVSCAQQLQRLEVHP